MEGGERAKALIAEFTRGRLMANSMYHVFGEETRLVALLVSQLSSFCCCNKKP